MKEAYSCENDGPGVGGSASHMALIIPQYPPLPPHFDFGGLKSLPSSTLSSSSSSTSSNGNLPFVTASNVNPSDLIIERKVSQVNRDTLSKSLLIPNV
jgi:hypothetical protein